MDLVLNIFPSNKGTVLVCSRYKEIHVPSLVNMFFFQTHSLLLSIFICSCCSFIALTKPISSKTEFGRNLTWTLKIKLHAIKLVLRWMKYEHGKTEKTSPLLVHFENFAQRKNKIVFSFRKLLIIKVMQISLVCAVTEKSVTFMKRRCQQRIKVSLTEAYVVLSHNSR